LNTEPSVQLYEIHPEKDSTPIVVAEQVLEESPWRMEGNLNSFWPNFDVSKLRNAGHKLEYIQLQIHNEVKFTKIVLEDAESEIKYWESVVVRYVLGASPPFSVLEGFIHRIWADYSIKKIVLMRNGLILVKFDSIDTKDIVL